MSKYIITAESTIDLNVDLVKKYDVKYVNYTYSLDNVDYKDNLEDKNQAKNFYKKLIDGQEPKTAQVNSEEFINFFKKYLDQGLDVLHLSFSSALSGTYNSARIAKEMLMEEYPNRKIEVIDTLAASSGFGLLLTKAYEMYEENIDFDTLVQYLNENKLYLNHWFYSTDLTYYIKGGRVTKAEGFIGKTLNICPILNVNDEGRLIPRHKVIGKKRVLRRILNKVSETIKDKEEYSDYIYLSHSNILEDALEAKKQLEKTYPNNKGVIINDIGPLIGSHTGIGTLAIFFWGDKREN